MRRATQEDIDRENVTDSINAKKRIRRPIVSGFKAIDAVKVVAVIVRINRDRSML